MNNVRTGVVPSISKQVFTKHIFRNKAGTLNVMGDKPWFIMYYIEDDNCRQCEAVSKKWQQLFVDYQHAINIAKLDCKNEEVRKVCQLKGIRKYPTLLLSKDDMQYEASTDYDVS